MKPVIQAKIEEINSVANIISSSKAFVVFEYSSMTAKEASDLRKDLTLAGNKMLVLKNNILRRAIQQSGLSLNIDSLFGQIAIAFGISDALQSIKAVYKLVKEKEKINFKIGFFDGQAIDADGLKQLASLPSREELYSMFLSVLQAPLRKLMYALKSVGEKK